MARGSAVHGLNDIRRRGRLACESHLSELPRMGHRWQWGAAARSCFLEWPIPMRPKARGLAQHGGPPGGLEESDPAGVICMWWSGRTAYLFHTVPVVLTGVDQLWAKRIFSWCYTVNVHNHPSWATSRKEGMARARIFNRLRSPGIDSASQCSLAGRPLR